MSTAQSDIQVVNLSRRSLLGAIPAAGLVLAVGLPRAAFADADDPTQAREEVGRLVVRILEGLKTQPEARASAGA